MKKDIFVVKRNGKKEKFNVEKIHRIVEWAINGYSDVNLSDIEINANLSLYDGISTEEIHKIVIESAANLISEKLPNYQYVAGRLLNYQLRKDVWGGKNAPKLYNLIKENVTEGLYDQQLLEWYSKKEIDKIDEYLDHDRDLHLPYAGIRQMCDKYLVQDRNTKKIFETPQFAYILVAMVLFHRYPSETRLDYVKKAYDYYSKHKINLPTPLLAGARTRMRSWASCSLIDVDDNMNSILASASAVGHATANRYGIGFNFGRIRGIGSSIRNGEVVHTGVIPFLKIFEAAVKSCQQSGLRGGSATSNHPIWHYEIEDILVLKNNAGTDDSRVRQLDYSIGLSKLFYDRFIKDENMTLFSPHEVKDLYEIFGHDGFDELYCKYEKDKRIKMKKVVKARDLFKLLLKERTETGRIYILNVDHANSHGPWLDDVKMSNLCVAPETKLFTKEGYIKISTLENKEVEVWNGKEWSKTMVVKTGENQSLLNISLYQGEIHDDGTTLKHYTNNLYVTPYHKFYLEDETEVRAIDLKSKDRLIRFKYPNGISVHATILSVKDEGRKDDTYCVNESLEHKVVFDGILTGNCMEITQPIIPLKDLNDPDAEIGVCVLSAINILETNDKEIQDVADIVVRGLEELIDIQSYFIPAAENFAKKRRSLGIGMTNFAAYLAKNGYGFDSNDAPNFVDELMEKIQYYLLKSSLQLAKERGACEKFNRTKYFQGILPIDTYKKSVDKFVTRKPSFDWEELRKEIKEHGLRHSSLTAMMPCESSSVTSSSTNGCEPVRSIITYKTSKMGKLPVIVPGIQKYHYTLAFDLKDMIPLININAVIQKYTDMAMSTNLYYNYNHYQDQILPDSLLFKHLAHAWSVGLKTLYYSNTDDGDMEQSLKKEEEREMDCGGGSCKI